MRPTVVYIFLICQFYIWLFSLPVKAQGEDVFDRTVELSKGRGTIYSLLGEVSDRSGFLFIYDSRLIDNEQKVRVKTGQYSLREAISRIIDNPNIGMRVMGRHIVLFKTEKTTADIPVHTDSSLILAANPDTFFTIEGIIRDQYTEEALPYASIGLTHQSVGTISNLNGEFRLRLPDSLRHANLFISYLGYETQEINLSILVGGYHQILLVPKVIPIQEVVVRISNPLRILEEMLAHRADNYAKEPVYHTAFYREGVEYKNRLANLTESVMKVYKTPYEASSGGDQVKMLKMRNIVNKNETDTLVTRFKAGINACLMLDLVKNLPEFLQFDDQNLYLYTHSDITVEDNRLANVISFEQSAYTKDPLYKGQLYIDMENHALLAARFEINPDYVHKTTSMFITKKSKNIQISPQKIAYAVSYKQWNGSYYVNHIRGDLYFKVRKKGFLSFYAPVHIWFEMVNCATDVTDVTRLSRAEIISTRAVFADTEYVYDESFWDNFNIISPEEQLTDAINKISAKIEETGY